MDTPLENKKNINKRLLILFVLGLFGLALATFLLRGSEELTSDESSNVFGSLLRGSLFGSREPAPLAEESVGFEDEGFENESLDVDEIMAIVLDDEDALVATLADVSGGEGIGTAYILRDEGMLYHYVTAVLPDLDGAEFYEGWLVNEETDSFFSTGQMQKGPDDTFVLGYSEDVTKDGYNKVVITVEKTIDKAPETHILEGTAENRVLE